MSEKLTLEQVLQKGIEAHKAGKVQEADQYYTAILQAQPTHPDANHNMGVLAVGVGKADQALPFFKKAIEANTTVEQFWISYIDALIRAQKTDEAKAALAQAKDAGVKDETLDQLEIKSPAAPQADDQGTNPQDPPEEQLRPLLEHYRNGNFEQALELATKLIQRFPTSAVLFTLCGRIYSRQKRFENAIDAYQKSLSIRPGVAEAHYYIGNAYRAQNKLDKAIKAYKKAITIKPDYANAHYNMGIALKE